MPMPCRAMPWDWRCPGGSRFDDLCRDHNALSLDQPLGLIVHTHEAGEYAGLEDGDLRSWASASPVVRISGHSPSPSPLLELALCYSFCICDACKVWGRRGGEAQGRANKE
jgi:hypothetical protein